MSLANWFRNSNTPHRSARLDSVINKALAYLKSRPDDTEVLPRILAKAIGESELTATTALRILEERGVTHHVFVLACGRTHKSLDRQDELHKLAESKYCNLCDEAHSQLDDTCHIELVYTIDREKLANADPVVSAA